MTGQGTCSRLVRLWVIRVQGRYFICWFHWDAEAAGAKSVLADAA